MNTEIERKFLLDKLPQDIEIVESFEIIQFYICQDKDKIVRLRKIGNRYNIGFKKGGGLSRFEKEISIAENDFIDLKKLGEKNKISKRRLITMIGKNRIEIDVFKENLEGLLVVEVEFETQEEAKKFVPPKWFAKEVTDDYKYTNSYLSSHSH